MVSKTLANFNLSGNTFVWNQMLINFEKVGDRISTVFILSWISSKPGDESVNDFIIQLNSSDAVLDNYKFWQLI